MRYNTNQIPPAMKDTCIEKAAICRAAQKRFYANQDADMSSPLLAAARMAEIELDAYLKVIEEEQNNASLFADMEPDPSFRYENLSRGRT